MKESRLFSILYHLIAHQKVTAVRLAEKLEVSVRTIYRDVERLCEAGIPVYTIPGRQGGLALVEGFTLDKVLFSEDEKRTILASLKSLDVTGEPAHAAVLQKLTSLFGPLEEDWLEVDFSGWGSSNLDAKKFELIKDAVINHRLAEIEYCNSNGEQEIRTIEPMKLLSKAKAWYVKAYCRTNEGWRLFKLSRILAVRNLDQSFERKSYPQADECQSGRTTTFVLRFPSDLAYRVYDEFNRWSVQKEADGSLLVTAHWPYDAWVVGYVLGLGSSVTVVEPEQLREAVLEQAKKICERYKT